MRVARRRGKSQFLAAAPGSGRGRLNHWHDYADLAQKMTGAVRTLVRLAILPLMAQAAIGRAAELPTLNSALDVRKLTPAQAALRYPAHLEAVVTSRGFPPNSIFAQDATSGIFVSCEQDCSGLEIGQKIVIEGVSRPGKFAPMVGAAHWKAIGKGPLPSAREESFGELSTGRTAGQWVAIRGTVRTAVLDQGLPSVEIAMADGRLMAHVFGATLEGLEGLVDATILARGVCTGTFNPERQFLRPLLMIPGLGQVAVQDPAAKDPFERALTPANQLLQFSASGDYGHREHVRGVVTYRRPEVLFIRDQGRALFIQTRRDTPLHLGDVVDASGFPSASSSGPFLEDALVRRAASGPSPAPVVITPQGALDRSLASELVRVEARLVSRANTQKVRALVMHSGDLFFLARLDEGGSTEWLDSFKDGSLLQMTGIWTMGESGNLLDRRPPQVLLRTPEDVVVLGGPPWWTMQHLLAALGGAIVSILACLAWAAMLRKRVRRQTAIITEKLEREAMLEQRYRSLFESALDIVFGLDLRGRVTSLNPAGERILGYRLSGKPGLKVARVVAPEYRRQARRLWKSIVQGAAPPTFELRTVARDGRNVILEISARLIHRDGKPVAVNGIARDITRRKVAEEELRASEERHRRLFDLNPAPSWVSDCETQQFLAVNEAAIRHYGYPRQEFLSMRTTQIQSAEDTRELERTLAAGLDCHESGPWRHLTKDGASILVMVNSHKLKFEGRSANLLLIQDVTERQQVEAERLEYAAGLEEARRLAENATKVKSQFLATISHEIRTPMNGVIGMTQLLLDAGLNVEQREYAEAIRSSAALLLKIVNDVLDFSKIEAGKMKLDLAPFDLRAVLEDVLELLARPARAGGLELNLDYGAGVPRRVMGDAGRIRQIALNLVGNAVKFTARGHVAVRVRQLEAAGNEAGALLRIEVEDTGIGIREDKRGMLFQSFTQADSSTTRKFGGTGLGLAISKQLVELMGGRIGFESVLGEGSTFWFEVRLETATKGPSPALERSGSGEDSAACSLENLRYRVLVAEDNVVNQKVAASILRKYGCRLDLAATGREAVEMWEKEPYDLIFMDCHMPEMDGYEATAEIRRREAGQSHTPIVAMTANTMHGDREECLAAGMDDHIGKPISLQNLLNALVRWGGAVKVDSNA
jgi:PAS domain S-box-containing protein